MMDGKQDIGKVQVKNENILSQQISSYKQVYAPHVYCYTYTSICVR